MFGEVWGMFPCWRSSSMIAVKTKYGGLLVYCVSCVNWLENNLFFSTNSVNCRE